MAVYVSISLHLIGIQRGHSKFQLKFSVLQAIMSNAEKVNYTKHWAHFAIAYVQLVPAL